MAIRRRKLIPMAAIAANIALNGAKYYARRNAAKLAAAAAAAAGATALLKKRKSKPKVTRKKYGVNVYKASMPRSKPNTQLPARRGRNMNFPTGGKSLQPKNKFLGQAPDSSRQYVNFSSGKKLSTSKIVDKTVNASLQRSIFYWRNYSVEATTNNFNLLLENSISGTTRYFPMYMFDLTARPQWPNRGQVNAIFGYRAQANTTAPADGRIYWSSVNGLDGAGASSNIVQIDESTALATLQSSGKSLINWFDIKAQLQGARSVPCKVTMELIKLLDADLDPINNQVATTTNDQHQEYWGAEVAALTVNPIHTYTRPKKSYVKVISSKTFVMQPKESIDNDVRGQMTVVKWFNRINKIINYNNKGNIVQDDIAYQSTALIYNPQGESVSTYADAKDKYYLRVKAYAVYNPAGGFSAALHPSFELNCRMCHSTLV